MACEPCGMILVDKPTGPTSRGVVEMVGRILAPAPARRRRGEPRFRLGHAGTLDPLATGLLVILVGRGTRLQPFLQGLDKRYLATVRLGAGTDSHDRDGTVTERVPVPPTADGLAGALAALTGTIMQVPPVISAIKRDGRSLHHRVRRGEVVAPPDARPVRILDLVSVAIRWGEESAAEDPDFLAPDGRLYEVDLDIACGSGTYVRSLARDLAAALGTVGHVATLRRTVVGPFDVKDAVTLDELADGPEPTAQLRSLNDALPQLPEVPVTTEAAMGLRQGTQPDRSWFLDEVPELFRLVGPGGELVAVGRREADTDLPRTAAVFPTDAARIAEDDPCA